MRLKEMANGRSVFRLPLSAIISSSENIRGVDQSHVEW